MENEKAKYNRNIQTDITQNEIRAGIDDIENIQKCAELKMLVHILRSFCLSNSVYILEKNRLCLDL